MKTKVFLPVQKCAIFFFLMLASFNAHSQVSGNQVYRNSYDQGTYPSSSTVSINDNILSVTVKVLLNKKADGFVITLGLNEESETVSGCNKKIQARISGLTEKLKTLGIKKENLYVDFISQTKIYDYTITEMNAQQVEKGFEIKKNIIITTSNVDNLEKIIAFASDYEIHDVIKVDYYNENMNSIHDMLFDDALAMAGSKKDRYIKSFGKRISGTPNATEEFSVIFPKTQYRSYQASESAEIETNANSRSQYLKKLARKNKTFYYDGISSAGLDKVINSSQTEVGIQYLITLTVSYKIDTSI